METNFRTGFQILLFLGMIFLLSMMVPPILLRCLENIGGFHLHLLVFPFVYLTVLNYTDLVESIYFHSISKSFQNIMVSYLNREASFDSISFKIMVNSQLNQYHSIIWVIKCQFSCKYNWKWIHYVNKLENERKRIRWNSKIVAF